MIKRGRPAIEDSLKVKKISIGLRPETIKRLDEFLATKEIRTSKSAIIDFAITEFLKKNNS